MVNRFTRSSGILLHPTSLPGRFGIGDLGPEAYRFADFLRAGDQTLWQVLPLGPTGYGDSPYQCFSAFAGNTLMISLERLVDDGFLEPRDIERVPNFSKSRVDFGRTIKYRASVLEKAFEHFKRTTDTRLRADFLAFTQKAAHWLDDYALFRALKDSSEGASWIEWDHCLAFREPDALAGARENLRAIIEAQKFYQYLFFRQWSSLKRYANGLGIKLIGDMPIFVAFDSVDVWTQPELFKLNGEFRAKVVAGVPPDYFSSSGQLWGNPLYEWDRMRETGYAWWTDRMRATLELFDFTRIDHFRGFAACWEIPSESGSAEQGRWVEVPGRELFEQLRRLFGDLPIIAEDLGVITPDVLALRDEFGFPGMRILQFAFRDDCNTDLPHNYVRNTVVYTGTHDNDTAIGWFNSKEGTGSTRDASQIEKERQYALDYLKSTGKEINWDFIRAAFASVADAAIIPLQDVLGLGSNARMNLPASQQGNWTWRFKPDALTEELCVRLRKLNQIYVRNRGTQQC